MNSQFKNSNLGFYLYALIIIIIAFASIFVFWYMVTGYSLGTYEEDTILGSVYLGGLKEEEVEPKINDRINSWQRDESIVFEVTYQGYSYEFDRELFYFNLPLSISNIKDGQTNELFAGYQLIDGETDERQIIIDEIMDSLFLEGISDQFDYVTLIKDVLKDASYMKSFSSKSLEDYLIDPLESIVEVRSIELNLISGIDVDEFILGINTVYPDGHILIPSKEVFDMIQIMGGDLSDSEMSMLSKGILALMLETNFAINEVHYVEVIDYLNYDINSYPYFGFNASINTVIGNSFSFYNPNNSDYYFTVEKVNDSTVVFKLMGLDFVDVINVSINQTVLEYITQTTDEGTLVQTGYDGVIIVVVRTITDIYGNDTYENDILFEFYPPIKQIILEP